MLEGFVCIRVDVDQQQEVAKQYSAKAMPDLRLLDPDGKQLKQLLGLSSPDRMLRECTAVLDQLAGRPVAADAAKSAGRRIEPTADAVRTAIARGGAFLEQQVPQIQEQQSGVAGLGDAALLALVCGGRADSEAGRALQRSVVAAPLTSTYQVAFQAMALARLDAKGQRSRLEECLRFLATNQLSDGTWSYGSDAKATGDHSNTAYALLGVEACARAGLQIPPELVQRTERAWRKAQNDDGGWGYRKDREADSYASMTESALASLVLCRRLRGGEAGQDEAIDRGLKWLAAHGSVEQNLGSAYQQGRLLYHLYALERAGSLLHQERFGELDWHTAGAAMLLGSQRDDGSWDDGADMPAANTAFALLFLTRATRRD